ncbi:MAG: hypothetical protein IH987_02725 [Planctomycetes bacterium]|nr:hypothetical protein [Planctomycetota bacterium]
MASVYKIRPRGGSNTAPPIANLEVLADKDKVDSKDAGTINSLLTQVTKYGDKIFAVRRTRGGWKVHIER